MSIDRYTKAVLTVIAGSLLYICVMLSGASVSAQAPFTGARYLADAKPQPVVVVGWGTIENDGSIRVATVRDDRGVHSDAVLPTKVREMPVAPVAVSLDVTASHPLPVGLTAVIPGPEWEPIRTKVEPAPTRPQPGGF